MGYVPLVDVTPKNGEAAVVFAALQSAGFDVVTECDLRGWMHYYRPFMSLLRPVTIWVPASQSADARGYLQAPIDAALDDEAREDGFWWAVRSSRRWACGGYLALVLFLGG